MIKITIFDIFFTCCGLKYLQNEPKKLCIANYKPLFQNWAVINGFLGINKDSIFREIKC